MNNQEFTNNNDNCVSMCVEFSRYTEFSIFNNICATYFGKNTVFMTDCKIKKVKS